MLRKVPLFLLGILLISVTSCSTAKKASASKKGAVAASKPKKKPKKGGIQPYSKVITKDAKSDEGLFTVHEVSDKYFYEIPDSLFNREMLMVTRIAKTASGLGFGGGKQNTQVLRWEKNKKKVLLRVVSHSVVAADSLPVHEAVVNSNFEPILFSFAIKEGFSKEETLACFGQYYFDQVLLDLKGSSHQNIRNFMKTGFEGLNFDGESLKLL